MVDLTEADKARIRLEEQYRLEVRLALGDGERRNPLLALLQTPLGLLVAGIVVSLVTWGFTRYETHQTAEKRRVEAVEALDIELSYRFSVVLLRLQEARALHLKRIATTERIANDGVPIKWTDSAEQREYRRSANENILALLWKDPSGEYPRLDPNFQSDSPVVLMARLRVQLNDDDEKRELDGVMALLAVRATSLSADLSDSKAVASALLRDVMKSRWKKGYFPLTDCLPSSPFC